MGGTLSNRHGKPRKNLSLPKTSPSPSKTSSNSTISLSNKTSPQSLNPNSLPIPPLKSLPIQDNSAPPIPKPATSTQASNQDSKASNQDSKASLQDSKASNQDSRASVQDSKGALAQDSKAPLQDSKASNQDSRASVQDSKGALAQDSKASNQDSVASKPEEHNENELETLLLSKLDKAYNEALSRLIALGYQKKNALRAILSSGHCQGHFDLLTNILKNSIKYLTYPNEKTVTFSSLKQLEENSLSDLISCLQKHRPDFSRFDAMRYLLLHELHVGEITGTNLIPTVPHGTIIFKPVQAVVQEEANESEEKDDVESDDDDDLEIDIDVLHDFVHQYCDVAIQVGEIKEWAQEKALQAAKKLSNDLVEFRVLRVEKEIGERMQKKVEEKISEMEKRVEELEKEVKRTAEELERVQKEVKKLEMENKEMMAEIEAAKLSGADSSKACKRLEKKVKRLEKNCEGLEKQKAVLSDELTEIKRKKKEVQDEVDALRNAIREFKTKLNEETRLKDQAKKLIEIERKANELTKVNAKKKLQYIKSKYELDTKRNIEQVEILKCEIARLNEAIFSAPSSSSKLCRPCIFCGTAEASMVFLPCRHEVLCAGCGQDYEDIGSDKCPSCNVKIEETVYIYGLSSS